MNPEDDPAKKPSGPVSAEYGSRSLRGTQVAAVFYTLCETARSVALIHERIFWQAGHPAIAQPGTITFPEELIPATATL